MSSAMSMALLPAGLQATMVSLMVSLSIVVMSKWAFPFLLDAPGSGVQKLHVAPVARIGGLAVVCGVLTYLLASGIGSVPHAIINHQTALTVFFYALPVFAIGLVEDCTKSVSPAIRLITALICVTLLGIDLGILIVQTDVPALDHLLRNGWLSVSFTAFALAGFTQAVNIIDGLHGLAAGLCVAMLGGIAFVANQQSDLLVTELALAGIAGVVGFWILNFPRGFIFLGDGGAYFVGLWIGICATLLMCRQEVSALQMIAICGYPVIETVFSMVRRRRHRRPVGLPDRLHLHTLLYRRCAMPRLRRRGLPPWHGHMLTTASIVSCVSVFVIYAVMVNHSPMASFLIFLAQILAYFVVYRRLIFFRWR
ncbi:Rfe UDP-N-acetylmuramyl pentapeptide phosphotransferase/UDP-N- acetylglucosamine-1-phosphate transferase [Oxalobacteraceae bacterium]